jgi:quercetin 2,3-dioxygenase
MSTLRTISKIFTPAKQPEGDGAEVRRIIGSNVLRNLDPFLMMDHFDVCKPNGFPDHPHRGFETVTYMLEGKCKHEDFRGHYGEIDVGDIQWMTAGRGIVHAEMPGTNRMEGLQLWVNLSSRDKMCEPDYQEKKSSEIVTASKDGVEVRIIAGESLGQRSETVTRTPAFYLDIKMNTGAELVQNVPSGWNSFIYLLSGKVAIGNKEVKSNQAAVLSVEGNTVIIKALEHSRLALLAGRPIGEKIVQYGPFVMNENVQINEAMRDYSAGINGFEGSRNWNSRISRE